MDQTEFIHLRVCSDFSMRHGLAKVEKLVERVAKLGMPAMALTDFTNLCGLFRFYEKAHCMGIKPIIGSNLYLYCTQHGERLYTLTLLAANQQGYQNLIQLISRAYLRGTVLGEPAIDRDWLREHNTGLIVLSGGPDSDVGTALLCNNLLMLEKCLSFYQKYFPDHYYLEVHRTGKSEEEEYLQSVLQLANETQLPVVATHPVYFIDAKDFEAHEIRTAIYNGYTINDPKRPKKHCAQQYLCSSEEMQESFADLPELLENSVQIAKRCNVTLNFGDYFMPYFPTGSKNAHDYLCQQAYSGLEDRLIELFVEEQERARKKLIYRERLERELLVIGQMGFASYFLIVMEFIKWAKQQDIPVGPGRGSGPGSLVAYVLQITDLDPLAFSLLFERFLNPERVSLPDFDIDFCMDKRDLVIEHVEERYGREAVAQIITFGTLNARAVVRDVGRVLGYPYGFVDRLAKLIPHEIGITLERAFILEPQLLVLYEQDEEVRSLIDKARQLEGVTRNVGKHAGGVVIAPTKITDFAPLYCDSHGKYPVTQFDKNDVERVGLVKFDFLGLRTLTIIHAALQSINVALVARGENRLALHAISLKDPKSFALLQTGETTAIFQLESRGMKDLINRLKPDCFEDLIALVALFRPGPLQSGMVDNFINRKHRREAIAYPDDKYQHACLQPILEPTYGIILYQEQVMQIAQVLAGYTLGEADLLRRAMGKKQVEEMAQQRAVFEKGARDNGIDGVLAIKIFDLVEKFAGYGFNKSHSAAYALISLQTLWLKAHFPAYFMAAVLNADLDNVNKVVILLEECRRMGLAMLRPNINTSYYGFVVNSNEEITYGLGAIKGVGANAVAVLVSDRDIHGPFTSLLNLCVRIDIQKVHRRTVEKLIMSGACDVWSIHRGALMQALDEVLKQAEQHKKALIHKQADMFGLPSLTQSEDSVYLGILPWSERQCLAYERETLGYYMSGHPITQYQQEFNRYIYAPLKDIKPSQTNKDLCAGGLVIAARIATSKQGKRIAILTLEDVSGRLDLLIYGDTLDKYRNLLEKDKLLLAYGLVSMNQTTNKMKMTVRKLIELQEIRARQLRALVIKLNSQQVDQSFCQKLQQILSPCHSLDGINIHVYYQKNQGSIWLTFGQQWQIKPTDSLLAALREFLGVENIVLRFDESN